MRVDSISPLHLLWARRQIGWLAAPRLKVFSAILPVIGNAQIATSFQKLHAAAAKITFGNRDKAANVRDQIIFNLKYSQPMLIV